MRCMERRRLKIVAAPAEEHRVAACALRAQGSAKRPVCARPRGPDFLA